MRNVKLSWGVNEVVRCSIVLLFTTHSARGLVARPPAPRFAPVLRGAWRPLRRPVTPPRGVVRSLLDTEISEISDKSARPDAEGRGKLTLTRVILPTIAGFVGGALLFAPISLVFKSFLDQGQLSILGNDSSQFMQNFLTVNGLLFSILAGNAFVFLYAQTESIYYALFAEVSETKSLLEQTTLVCQGRPFYQDVLRNINLYIQNDLKRLDLPPAVLLSNKPSNDPLETILYMTSVGVPSVVYETVKSLRAARGYRLGATQRKLPEIHLYLLYFLAVVELIGFPILGAGTASLFTNSILNVESIVFGLMTAGITMTIQIIRELWRPMGGAYNVDGVLSTMVEGLELELDSRMTGGSFSENMLPSPPPSFGALPPTDMASFPAPVPAVTSQEAVNVIPAAGQRTVVQRTDVIERSAAAAAAESTTNAHRRGIRGLFGRAKRTSRDV